MVFVAVSWQQRARCLRYTSMLPAYPAGQYLHLRRLDFCVQSALSYAFLQKHEMVQVVSLYSLENPRFLSPEHHLVSPRRSDAGSMIAAHWARQALCAAFPKTEVVPCGEVVCFVISGLSTT